MSSTYVEHDAALGAVQQLWPRRGEPKMAKTGNPIGRPTKKEKRKVGRPKGEAGIMKEYRERMLKSPRSKKVLDSIFKAALDDDHKNQAAAWKIIVDRIVPVSGFEKEAGGTQRAAIQVNITGVEGVEVSGGPKDTPEEVLEGDFSEVPS
jgi:hypothetical protein